MTRERQQIAHAQKMALAQRMLTTISQFQLFRFRFPLQFSVSAFRFRFPFPPFPLAPTDAFITVQIGSAEPLLASFLFILSFYEENLGGRGYVTVLSTDSLQAPFIELVESYLLILEH